MRSASALVPSQEEKRPDHIRVGRFIPNAQVGTAYLRRTTTNHMTLQLNYICLHVVCKRWDWTVINA